MMRNYDWKGCKLRALLWTNVKRSLAETAIVSTSRIGSLAEWMRAASFQATSRKAHANCNLSSMTSLFRIYARISFGVKLKIFCQIKIKKKLLCKKKIIFLVAPRKNRHAKSEWRYANFSTDGNELSPSASKRSCYALESATDGSFCRIPARPLSHK